MPKVFNKYTATPEQLRNAIYAGRPSRFGNPFVIGKDGTREEVIEKYREWVLYSSHPDAIYVRAVLKQGHTRGKNWYCSCAPKPCHADVLLEIANS